ncbi:Transcription elongation factor (TFIIS) family protein [Rhynchospora pubera]|uniref:Transcription elongation factor (TFIIS) family protein n=1 Tax=Rhynchospora pubera TaxID=906938 RepID=A0AAV8GIE9_9POAL|nr:Transcription elongation factor (TFIIS) family protein [Rhynchospora pubera]
MAASKNPATNLEYWTEFFHGANGSIFDVIENAILVAANDFPQELRSRRDRIVEKMYTVAIPRCFSCIERCNQQLEEAGSVKHERESREKEKEGPEDIERMVVSGSGGSNCSYEEVEAITEEIERESETLGEVLRIKEILLHKEEKSESTLFEALRRLQLMELSVNTLQATEIGKAVNGLRKHNSKQIRQLVRILIEGWKELVDEWVGSTALVSDKQEEENEYNDQEEEEEGLPSPPLDEGAFLATQTTGIQLDEFFDGMDDDGNLKCDTALEKKREAERKSGSKSNGPVMWHERPVPVTKHTRPPSLHNPPQMKPPQGNVSKPSRPVNMESGPGRPPRQTQNLSAEFQRKPPAVAHDDRLKCAEDDRLEAAKKRLHEGYQQAQNAKKQRTIQMLGENEIPKPKAVPQNRFHNNMKPKNGIRSRIARH